MYLFSRRARLAPGNIRAAMTWANAVTEKANQISSLDISLFSSVFSPGVGTLVWSTFAPDLASLEAATDKLAADDGYAAILDEGSKFIQPGIDDGLLQLIHGEPN